jgi:6-phosphogluconolactonase
MTDIAHPPITNVTFAPEASDEAIADFIAGLLTGDQPHAMAVPGSSTPQPILEILAKKPLQWTRIAVHLTDDRCVPYNHEASNFGMVEHKLAATNAALVEMREGAETPPFDLVWVGMGTDGHVASLFPNTDPRIDDPDVIQRIIPDPLPPEAPFERLTMTLPALVRTKHLMVVIKDHEKKAVIDAAIAGESDLPVTRLLRAASCPVTIFWRES